MGKNAIDKIREEKNPMMNWIKNHIKMEKWSIELLVTPRNQCNANLKMIVLSLPWVQIKTTYKYTPVCL